MSQGIGILYIILCFLSGTLIGQYADNKGIKPIKMIPACILTSTLLYVIMFAIDKY